VPASRSNQVPTFPPALTFHDAKIKWAVRNGLTEFRSSPASTRLPRPITIPEVVTLKTLAEVWKLLHHIPRERRGLSTWQHVEKTLQARVRGADPANISVALQIVLQADGVPHQT
jgi:hypothetical protein